MTRMVPVIVVMTEEHVELLDQWTERCREEHPEQFASLAELQTANGWANYMMVGGSLLAQALIDTMDAAT